ncbi:dTDP-4-dehydrorhamnose 3,5-epimerase [Roseateles albus]|uniref:dTDP-4-dehydrorhamnose 3,5-epimerase n=1 Tax=Roseateles albus TaxID=2987525 RepID=A0ABT5KH10_9BURK|nr:dTDP-4-dehydrorhamnose 3,5-epimerase [Roseateles albus]MDC8772739.1 dTDP-4-dehydrorhamnose 3,5-epimerase [Roseateles albus]
MLGVTTTKLRRIQTVGGDVLHGMKNIDAGFDGFGEVYFSFIKPQQVKGWKRHEKMTLNFVVPVGEIQVCVCDEKSGDSSSFVLGPRTDELYNRLTIRPGLWVAFGGLGSTESLLVNIASIPHDPTEATNVPLDSFSWSWPKA